MRLQTRQSRFFKGMFVAMPLAIAAWALIALVLGVVYFLAFD